MLTSLLFSALATASAFAKSHIVNVSILQNGYALVTRRIDVSPDGDIVLDELPQATQGTIWFTSTDGLKLHSVRATTMQTPADEPVADLFGLLNDNIGQQVRLTLEPKNFVSGKLVSLSSQVAFLEQGGSVAGYSMKEVSAVLVLGGVKMSHRSERAQRILEIGVTGNREGALYETGLEGGLTWTPAYSIDISDPTKAKIVLKATVSDDLGELKGVDARLVSGFPNTGYAGALDTLVAASNVVLAPGAAYVPRGIDHVSYDPTDNSLIVSGTEDAKEARRQTPSPMDNTNRAGQNEADMFFYTEPKVSLDLGDRAYYVLADSGVDYKDIYAWDAADPIQGVSYVGSAGSEDVWHSLSFTNTLGLPLTRGPAAIYKDGELLGQDTMKYVSQGGDTVVRITKALDLHAEALDEEVSRKRQAMSIPGSGSFDEITLRTTLKVTSNLKTAAHLKITRPFTGTLNSFDDGKVTSTTRGLRSVNASGTLEWERDVLPGATVMVKFESKVYVRSGQ